jgi:CMP-N,N'-diacetyllegionaminic acid synthase
MKDEKILITLCARGGSKGIKNKNIALIKDKPLIQYSINHANTFAAKQKITKIALSTDSNMIKKIASQFGVNTTYTRPEELATDTAGKLGVIKDLLFFEETQNNNHFDWILDLDISSPLRTSEDLISAFEKIKNKEDALNLFSVSNAHKNPYFNMVEVVNDEFCTLCKQLPNGVTSRQTAPKVYELNASFYFYKRSFFDQEDMRVINSKSLAYVMPHICFDIDEKIDLEFMQFLIENNKLDFQI